MQSAYLILGIPGNASIEDIEVAFKNASIHYSSPKLASDILALEKFLEIKTAYKVLRDPESRAAHDRKLNSAGNHLNKANAVKRPVVTIYAEPENPWYARPLPVLAVVVVLIFSFGFYVNQKRLNASQEILAKELKLKQLAAEEAAKEDALQLKEKAEKEQLARKNEQQERQFRSESDRAFANARAAETQRGYQDIQRESVARQAEQRREYEARAREQNLARESQQRVAKDQARIRELCYQNYRRADC